MSAQTNKVCSASFFLPKEKARPTWQMDAKRTNKQTEQLPKLGTSHEPAKLANQNAA
jgi:hypothetical protein